MVSTTNFCNLFIFVLIKISMCSTEILHFLRSFILLYILRKFINLMHQSAKGTIMLSFKKVRLGLWAIQNKFINFLFLHKIILD